MRKNIAGSYSAGISGIGVYSPKRILTNDDLAKLVNTSDEWITERTGIQERHIAAPEEASSDLAYQAYLDLAQRYPFDPQEIDLIIVGTVTPDTLFPTTANLLQDKIGASNAGAMDILAACCGFLYALSTGAQFIQAGTYRKVLVFGVDTMSRITDWEDRYTCVLFGDAAGVVLLERVEEGEGILDIVLRSDGKGACSLSMPAGGSRLPATEETVKTRQHFLKMNGRDTFAWAVRRTGEVIESILARNDLTTDDIALVICHQANRRIIEATWKKFKMPPEKFYINIQRYGNTTSASIPLAISEAMAEGKLKKGDRVILNAFGAGFTWGAILLKWGIDA